MHFSATDYSQLSFEHNAFKRDQNDSQMITNWGGYAMNGNAQSAHVLTGTGLLSVDRGFGKPTVSAAQFHQTRWEDVDRSTKAQRGSASQLENNTSLVMTTVEQHGTFVVKRFKEAAKVDPEADARSVSNRSVTSQSNKAVFDDIRKFKLPDYANESSELSVIKEVQKVNGEVKSEHFIDADHMSVSESQTLTEVPVNKQLDFDVTDADLKEAKSERLVSMTPVSVHKRYFKDERIVHAAGVLPTPEPYLLAKDVPLQDGHTEVSVQVANVGRYDGELINGRMCGYGRLYDNHGRLLFEGDFVNDLYDGVGVLYNYKSGSQPELLQTETLDRDNIDIQFLKLAWDRYEGLFKEGRFHGKGYLYFGSRYIFFAKFKEGNIESGCARKDLVTGRTQKLSIYGQEVVKKSN